MDAIIRQGKAHEDGGCAEQFLKLVDDGDAAAGADENRRHAEALLVSGHSRAHGRVLAVNEGRVGAKESAHLAAHCRRR